LDENNVVTMVIVGKDETEPPGDWEAYYGAKRTSYNTRGGIYYGPDGQPAADQSKAFRKNYAGVGSTYDPERDAFIPPQPWPSWILDETTCLWVAPVPQPEDGQLYYWDEGQQQWEVVAALGEQNGP